MSTLTLDHVSVSRRGIPVLSDITLAAGPGIVAISGTNGAGKTTLLHAISGFLPIRAGRVALDGQPLNGLPPYRRAAAGIRRIFQEIRLAPQLSIADHLIASRSPASAERVMRVSRDLLDAAGLIGREHDRVAQLSYGQRKVLSLVCVAATPARVVLLDEPLTGLSPATRQQAVELIRMMGCAGVVLVVEHDTSWLTPEDAVLKIIDGRVASGATP